MQDDVVNKNRKISEAKLELEKHLLALEVKCKLLDLNAEEAQQREQKLIAQLENQNTEILRYNEL